MKYETHDQMKLYLQKDVAESEDILKLGLLFGEDIDATAEDLPAVLSFQHKLIQEYLAAVYIAQNTKQDTAGTFLHEAFPSWEKIETHREVVQFACGILADTDAKSDCITNHVAKVLAQHIHNELNAGNELQYSDLLSIVQSCQKEGGISAFNPYLSEYPACGRPLAEVLDNTQLAYIDGILENDTLQLNPSSSQIIVKLDRVDSETYDRLWQALQSKQCNVIALDLCLVRSRNVTKLQYFTELKCLSIMDCDCSEEEAENLAEIINSWGPQPQLINCLLWGVPIPRSVLSALCACTNLLALQLWDCDLHDKLSVLMASLPPIRALLLENCSLCGGDVHHITQAVREGRLSDLQYLHIGANPVGEVAVGSLLEALSTRTYTKLRLELMFTGVDEDGEVTDLSEQFDTEWQAKLSHTDWDVLLRVGMISADIRYFNLPFHLEY